MCITFLIFVPWKKGPAWYLRFSDKVFFVLLLTNYILLPAINNIVSVYWIINPVIDLKVQAIESYIIFFNVICFMRMIEYVTIIRRTVLVDARTYLEIKEMENQKSEEEIKEELLTE